MHRSAVSLELAPGQEAGYRAWLEGCPRVLGDVYRRTGIRKKAVMMAGTHVIAHFEAERPDSVAAAFSSPEAGVEFAGALGRLLAPGAAPVDYESVLHWDEPVSYRPRHVALRIDVKPGREADYLRWVRDDLVRDFEACWRRAALGHKEVLTSGRRVIAFYHARDSASVLQTFAEPESQRAMQTTLGPLLDLDPARPFDVYEEAYVWRAA